VLLRQTALIGVRQFSAELDRFQEEVRVEGPRNIGNFAIQTI
jgi:hypothetical protein